MTLLQIVCDNCGAKYRLPETFNGAKAKCKQCNSAIDVAAQRAAAEAPAAAPAAARPARAGSPARPAPSPARSAPVARSSSVRAPRREAEAPPPSNKKPLIFAGIGGVAVIVVVAVLLNSGKPPAKSGPPTAQAPNATSNDGAKAPSPAASKPADSQPPADASAKKRAADGPSAPTPLEPAAPAGQKPQGKSPDKQAPKPSAQPADTSSGVKSATSGAGASGKGDAMTDERTKLQQKELDAWMKLGTKTLAEVLDPKKVTQALEYPAEVSEDDKKKLASLYQAAKDDGGGARTTRALKEIGKMGVGGLYFMINQLREIDYKNYDEVVWAGQLNLSLLDLTLGVNTGFVPVEAGADPTKLDPRIAQWDAMTVEKWMGGVKAQWSSKAKWDEYVANRKARKDKELEEGDKK